MKRLYLLSTLVLIIMVTMLSHNVRAQISVWDGTYAPWTNGTGTEADPFLIENAQQLAYLAYRVNNGLDASGGHISNHDLHYKLMIDVNLNGSESFQWTPIGYWISETNYYSFGGHFDGNNHTVSGLYINGNSNRVGFFGYADGATIKNLSVSGDTIVGRNTGGIVGYVNETIIKNCSNACNNAAKTNSGTCGGVVGTTSGNTIITNCYNISSVSSPYCSGGIVGTISENTTITNCYSIGNITNHQFTYYMTPCTGGGIVGNGYGSVINCFYTCGNNTYGGSPVSTNVMQTPEFVGILNNGSCAWEQDVAPYVNDGFPILTMIMDSAYTEPATDLTAVSATLHGSILVEHASITSKGFEYRAIGDSTYTPINITGNENTFSYMLNGLTPNTTYEYRTFVNVSECPYTSYGDVQTFEVSWLNADTIYIYDADMLRWVSTRCNTGDSFEGKYIMLMNNIILPLNQPNNMTSIGVYPSYPFKGTFDGNGMTITNLYIDQPNTPYQGFFGYTQNANLYEVGLVNITASGRNYTGGMVAYAENTYMRDCYVNGGSLFALSYCGGLVGYQSAGTNSIISGCYNTCTVSGTSYVGGLVGFSDYATVRNSYVAASVAAQGSAVGAIIGGANEVLMYNCYFSTSITGQNDAIGEHNFRDGEGLSNEEMQSTQFVATLNQGLVTPVWKSDYAVPINNGFPILIWQYSDAEACEAPENLNYTISGNSATLTWNGGDNASYFTIEYGINGGDVHTENTSNHQLVIHNLQSGNYFWRVKSVCSFGESNFVNGNTIATGINNHDLSANMNVYPNPTSDKVNVYLSGYNGQSDNMEIQLFDIYGKRLQTVSVTKENMQIDLSSYAQGVYFIKVAVDGKAVSIRKVVKE